MDDDLRFLGATLTGPEPSADVVDRRRRQLRDAMRGPARRRSRRPFIALGTAAATAAAAVAVVVATDPAPSPPTTGTRTTAARMSGPQVLLAAATVAESQPKTSGTYWHVKTVYTGGPGPDVGSHESWTTVDGRKWNRLDDKPVTRLPGRHPIELRGAGLGLAEIEKLPTGPEELKKVLLKAASEARGEKAEITQDTLMVGLLTQLLGRVPAPPKVRAAALRALATLAPIENKGKVPGGQSLVFAGDGGGTKLVVDLGNATVLSSEGYADINGEHESMGVATGTAEWTDEPPA